MLGVRSALNYFLNHQHRGLVCIVVSTATTWSVLLPK
jgi:hypothetical protein